ncbi:MAG: AI-2E family transporter [Gracilimonas sp.]|uniref:AI-2E family transporter n=1 Tax=Gracilimonas sp. TaxID=1974203 RepID=UPI0019C90C24|nr:AI-2E family transporter [Gracilimonas sp.]MBD3615228.1 AI-2E family transporter [Gracilimonas sp.]
MNEYPLLLRSTIRLAFAFLLVAALILTRQLLVPLFLSVMLAYLLFPYADWLENHKVPRILTNLIVVLGFLAFLGAIFFAVGALSANFTDDFPKIKEQFEDNLQSILSGITAFTGISSEGIDAFIRDLGETGEYISQLFTATTNTLLSLGLLPVYTFLLLFYRDKFRDFISMLIKDDQEQVVQKIIDQASEVVPKYLKGLVIVCFILVGLNSLGFYLIGIEYALLFGIIAAIFNLIPYLGTILGYGVVLLFVLGTQSPSLAFAVIIQFVIVQFLENNILTPNITGSYVEINPLVIIFSLIGAGLIWGLPGMLIIIPYLGLFKIVCENVEDLKPIGFLLGNRGTERHSITIKSLQRRFGWLEED